jgi:hypothetical protein
VGTRYNWSYAASQAREGRIGCCGATWGTNNTGETIGIGHALLALMWLRDVDEATDIPTIMMFDNCYAANMVTGRWQPTANVALVEWARKMFADVEAMGRTVH